MPLLLPRKSGSVAFIPIEDIHDAYTASSDEALIWRQDYDEYERLADNGLLPDLDENLPEVNDGSLAASLFKLPKRVVPNNLTGRVKSLDRDDSWITELANIIWEKEIIPHANSQAPWNRKWKDIVRKSGIYGGQPVINLFLERGNYTGSDIIVPQAQDVKLEAGKVSDYDSNIIFWDVYYTKQMVQDMLEDACEEMGIPIPTKDNPPKKQNVDCTFINDAKSGKNSKKPEKNIEGDDDDESEEPYNNWRIDLLWDILQSNPEEERPANEEHSDKRNKGVKKSGIHFYIAFQRGVEAPFSMYHNKWTKEPIRAWSNPDPTGDVPVHYMYCYQDFVNPYGIGIVRLAGGTQNVLDYMRQSDVLATQIGIRPPKKIKGDINEVDFDSLTYTEDADWIVGAADVERMSLADGIYSQLPDRIAMYKTSLNQMIPTGDTSISAAAGDPNYSKTPAGVRFQATNLSIDDEDFKDNLYMCYADVAKACINTHFANMHGEDFIKITDEERDILQKAGIDFPLDSNGDPTNQLKIEWDRARSTFDFEVDPDLDKNKDDSQQLEGLLGVAKFLGDPTNQPLLQNGGELILGDKKINVGELMGTIVSLSTDNDKIVTDVTPEDTANQEAKAQAEAATQVSQMQNPNPSLPMGSDSLQSSGNIPESEPVQQVDQGQSAALPSQNQSAMNEDDQQALANIKGVMEKYHVDQNTAIFMLDAESHGYSIQEILDAVARNVQNQSQETQ